MNGEENYIRTCKIYSHIKSSINQWCSGGGWAEMSSSSRFLETELSVHSFTFCTVSFKFIPTSAQVVGTFIKCI